MIDHTRAFQFKRQLLNDRILRVRRSIYDKLMALSDDAIRDTLRPFLNVTEIGSLLERRKVLRTYVEELVAERGEAVFY